MILRGLVGLMLVLIMSAPLRAAGRAMTVDDLLAVKSVGDPQISPDGTRVVYVVSEIDRAANRSTSDLWMVPVAGGEPRRLTTAPGDDAHPRWSPDGKRIAFTSDRGGSSQIWLLPLDGGEAVPVTKSPIDVNGPIWSPDGTRLAFTAEVYPGLSPDQTAVRDKEKGEAKTKVKLYDHLMIRQWSSWTDGKRSHIFVCDAKTGASTDLTPKLDANAPPGPFGGSSEYAWSLDGREIAFVAEPAKDHAWSTNTDIWVVPADGGDARNLTAENPGADAQPRYADDATLLYLSQARAGFESDLWTMKSTSTGEDHRAGTTVSGTLDRPIQSFQLARGGKSSFDVFAVIDDNGTEPVIRLEIPRARRGVGVDPDGEARRTVAVAGAVNAAFQVADGGKTIVVARNDATHPAELYVARDGAELTPLTKHNAALLQSLDVAKAEGFSFSGADGDRVSGWLVRPPGFDAAKKYPVLFLIHGGPQGAWHDEWAARWNYQMFAAPGYVVVAVNPRGSTGYGQKFTDQISGDWSGRVYDDLIKGLDHALKTYPFLDESRMAAAGGSFGGYMVNWIAGHNDRFRCLISHAGVFDLVSKYGTTEELWFPEWEFGGTPWDKPELYREQSPSSYVANFKTPTLVIHGALDYRVPDTQGIGMFTSLQRRGVPSRLVYFPDEGHWILKPGNRVAWWNEMHAWLAKYLAGGAAPVEDR